MECNVCVCTEKNTSAQVGNCNVLHLQHIKKKERKQEKCLILCVSVHPN